MSDIELAPASDDDARAFRAIAAEALLFEVPEETAWPDGPDRDHLVVARAAGPGGGHEIVGGYVAWPLAQHFGGRAVPAAGLRAVAVASAHRGQGLADRMMRRALDDAAARGQCLAALYPATQGLYRKQGYEVAGHRVLWSIPLDAIVPGDRACAVRAATREDRPALAALHAARARATNGHLERPPWLWDRVLDPPIGPRRRTYVFVEDDEVTGYAVVGTEKDARASKGELLVHDHALATARSARAFRAFLADHRSMLRAALVQGAPSEPSWLPLEEQAFSAVRWQRFMIRLIDVGAALAARGYPPGLQTEVHLDIVDAVRPANAGRVVLSVAGGRGTIRRGGEGRLRADVRGLASLYAAYLSARELVSTGLLAGDDASLDAATAIFAGPQPYMTEMF